MRKLALSVAAILVLAVVSPAFAQPFADVPTDHWAFDAIAELAAKGIIEGFPDGTFKGDRGVTRYEVAMIVARILARIEAIKIPGPAAPAPAPQVTRADVQTIQRLVNEFRAELAALGVRVTAVEEELTALKQATSAIRVTGDSRIRYKSYETITTVRATTIEWRSRLKFTAKAAPNVTAFVQLDVGDSGTTTFDSGITPCSGGAATNDCVVAEYSYVSADLFGFGWTLGNQDGTLGNGLLFAGDPIGGLKVSTSLAGFSIDAGAFTGGAPTNYWTLRASTNLGGYSLGASYYSERPTAAAESTGYGVDFSGNLFGLSFMADYASWTPAAAAAQQAWKAQLDLGELMGMAGLGLSVWYKNYGTTGASAPTEAGGFSGTAIFEDFKWNFKGFGGELTTSLGPFSVDAIYETGERVSAAGAVNVYYLGLGYPLAANTSLLLTYRRQDGAGAVAGAQDESQYRVQVQVTY